MRWVVGNTKLADRNICYRITKNWNKLLGRIRTITDAFQQYERSDVHLKIIHSNIFKFTKYVFIDIRFVCQNDYQKIHHLFVNGYVKMV